MDAAERDLRKHMSDGWIPPDLASPPIVCGHLGTPWGLRCRPAELLIRQGRVEDAVALLREVCPVDHDFRGKPTPGDEPPFQTFHRPERPDGKQSRPVTRRTMAGSPPIAGPTRQSPQRRW